MNETTLSENPSSRPTMKAFAPRTLIRKNGRIGRIISLLMSVKRDTTPRMTTFTVSPYARDRRVAMVSRRMEEERDGDDRVDHYEQCALVPVASPIRDDSRDDSRRQGQGRELEDFEVEGHDLRGQERNENEDRRHEQRDLGRRRRRDGDAQFHLVPPGHEDRTDAQAHFFEGHAGADARG